MERQTFKVGERVSCGARNFRIQETGVVLSVPDTWDGLDNYCLVQMDSGKKIVWKSTLLTVVE